MSFLGEMFRGRIIGTQAESPTFDVWAPQHDLPATVFTYPGHESCLGIVFDSAPDNYYVWNPKAGTLQETINLYAGLSQPADLRPIDFTITDLQCLDSLSSGEQEAIRLKIARAFGFSPNDPPTRI